jgi:hypothetical protein
MFGAAINHWEFMRCNQSSRCDRPSSDSEVPKLYPLKPFATAVFPTSLPGLRKWLEAQSQSGHWKGKIYVASTIEWDDGERTFKQSGCSPNYRGGWWTLACCKHAMRAVKPFEEAVQSGQP